MSSNQLGNLECVLYCLVCRWFFGQIKRVDAEKLLLMDINDVGAYLVRESESVPGELFVCLLLHIPSSLLVAR